jgi:integrase
MGKKAIENITTDDVLKVLRPIWTTTTETADRLRGRIERVLDYATTHGWRKGDNPARWRGHLSNILPKPSTVVQVEHHAAVPWSGIAPVMKKLAGAQGMGALATRFACMTAARSGEVRGATWGEINLKQKVWILSADRMKGKKEHRVPLSEPALAVLEAVKLSKTAPDAVVFRGGRPLTPLTDVALSKALHVAAGTKNVTVHGFRSSFRDWASENTDYPRDVAEMALAHAIGSKVEAAYRRGDLFEKRREMM